MDESRTRVIRYSAWQICRFARWSQQKNLYCISTKKLYGGTNAVIILLFFVFPRDDHGNYRWGRTLNEKMKTLNWQGQSYGIISKLLEFRAKVAEPRMSLAIFVIRFSLVAIPLEPLPIFLEGLFSARRNEMLKHVYQWVKVIIIGMQKSKLSRKFSTKKWLPRKNGWVSRKQSNLFWI